jgi:exonuclease VII small subunit
MEARGSDLEAITARLERIAEELEAGPNAERAAELVREASDSAAEAGRAVEAALRAATDTSSP